jgi:two-component sensor histidine kinase
MGLTLIRSMATQLEGDVKTSTGEGGTEVCVRFPVRSGKTLHQ